ncbi:hypothetical protein BDW66DRAFT_148718 [Aspergillus desertorum]
MSPAVVIIPGLWLGPKPYELLVNETQKAAPSLTDFVYAPLVSTGTRSPGNPTMYDDAAGIRGVIKPLVEAGKRLFLVLEPSARKITLIKADHLLNLLNLLHFLNILSTIRTLQKITLMHTREDVAHHTTRRSCWVIINNQVYGVIRFLYAHPGGAGTIMKNAGKDVTAVFEATHPAEALRHLPDGLHLSPLRTPRPLGHLTQDRMPSWARRARSSHLESNPTDKANEAGSQIARAPAPAPHRHTIQNLSKLESIAKAVSPPNARVYCSSAADSLASLRKT